MEWVDTDGILYAGNSLSAEVGRALFNGGNRMKISGLKKAVGEYQRANAGGYYSPRYGNLMFDPSDGTVWTDEFYSLGHNSWKEYHDRNITCISKTLNRMGVPVTMKNVRELIASSYPEFREVTHGTA